MLGPHENLLDRDRPACLVREHFSDAVSLLREVVDYGTHLIVRCYYSSTRSLVDLTILGGLLKQAVAALDAVEICISNGAVLSSHVPARAFFEAQLYVRWILKADTETRANQYYVWILRQRRSWERRVIPGTVEHERFKGTLERYSLLDKVSDVHKVAQAQQQVDEINTVLARTAYKDINAAFDVKKPRCFDNPWYQPLSIRQLAQDLGLVSEYDVFYGLFSDVAHSRALQQHIKIRGDTAAMRPIRHLEGIDTVLLYVVTAGERLYQAVLNKYRPDECENLARKYLDDWGPRLENIGRVKYQTCP